MIFHSYVSLPEGNNINMTNDNYTSFQYEEFQLKHKKRRTCWDVFRILCTWKILETAFCFSGQSKNWQSCHVGAFYFHRPWRRRLRQVSFCQWDLTQAVEFPGRTQRISQRITAARLYWWNWESLRNWLKRSFWWLRLGRGCWNEKNEKTLARGKRMEENGREWNRLTFTFDP